MLINKHTYTNFLINKQTHSLSDEQTYTDSLKNTHPRTHTNTLSDKQTQTQTHAHILSKHTHTHTKMYYTVNFFFYNNVHKL